MFPSGFPSHIMEEILKRAGKYLIRINFDLYNSECAALVNKYCKNVETISYIRNTAYEK